MLTDPKLHSQIDQLWDKLWTGGLSSPFDAIEQLSYLFFLKRLDDAENRAEKQAKRRGQPYQSRIPVEQANHRRAQRPVPHVAPHHPFDGADDRSPARRTHRRPGSRHLRLPGQRLPDSGKTLLHTLRGDLVKEIEKQMRADHNDD